MKQENFDYLKKQLFYKGYKDSLDEELQSAINKNELQFALGHVKDFGNDKVTTTLRYGRSDQGRYFLNKVEAELKKENGEVLNTAFYMDKNSDFTLKQMYNLLSGRFVEKEKETRENVEYRAWDQLDFTQRDKYGNYPVVSYGERYGFDLAERLDKEPLLANRNAEDRKILEASLKRGNLEKVVYELDGERVDKYIFANVKMRTIDRFDSLEDYNKAMAEKLNGKSVGEKPLGTAVGDQGSQGQSQSEAEKSSMARKVSEQQDENAPGEQKKNKKRGVKM